MWNILNRSNIILKNGKIFITFNKSLETLVGVVSTVEEGQPDHRGSRSKQQVTFNAHSLYARH